MRSVFSGGMPRNVSSELEVSTLRNRPEGTGKERMLGRNMREGQARASEGRKPILKLARELRITARESKRVQTPALTDRRRGYKGVRSHQQQKGTGVQPYFSSFLITKSLSTLDLETGSRVTSPSRTV